MASRMGLWGRARPELGACGEGTSDRGEAGEEWGRSPRRAILSLTQPPGMPNSPPGRRGLVTRRVAAGKERKVKLRVLFAHQAARKSSRGLRRHLPPFSQVLPTCPSPGRFLPADQTARPKVLAPKRWVAWRSAFIDGRLRSTSIKGRGVSAAETEFQWLFGDHDRNEHEPLRG